MEPWTIEELNMLIDGISAQEALANGGLAGHLMLQLVPEETRNDPKYQEAIDYKEQESRAKMEAFSLLKTKLIQEKMRIEAASIANGYPD